MLRGEGKRVWPSAELESPRGMPRGDWDRTSSSSCPNLVRLCDRPDAALDTEPLIGGTSAGFQAEPKPCFGAFWSAPKPEGYIWLMRALAADSFESLRRWRHE